jgi:Fur family zinc uptake transcriptional regulator
MTANQSEQILKQAEIYCSRRGGRLTLKRRRVLELVLNADSPLSAYQLGDLYSNRFQSNISIMSVYRMLEFLVSHSLVHRLETTNQYLSCTHIRDCCKAETSHSTPQFLICDHCHQVYEIPLGVEVLRMIHEDVERNGFTMLQRQIEIHGTCKNCSNQTYN